MRAFIRRTQGRTSRKLRLALLAAGILLVALPAIALAAFSDVPVTHTHFAGVTFVEQKGITTGYSDGTYRPDNPVTRGQMATFIHRTSGVLVPAGIHVTRGAADAPVVQRWFNNVNGVAPTISGSGGSYDIDMGFPVTTRFVSVTVDTNFVDTRDAFATVSTPGGNIVRVRIHDVSVNGQAPAEFFVNVLGG